ncbi:MAG: hypothetical protein ACI8S6_002306 [Myxococcota bacterium]|jgi:hypothetical protein
MMWPVLLLSCDREPTALSPIDEVDTTVEADEDVVPLEPGWDAATVAAQISVMLAYTAPDPVTINNDVFTWIMSQGDAKCPGTLSFRIGDCTASTGYRFFGIADYFEERSGEDEWWVSLSLGDMIITDPDGEAMLIGGTYELERDGDRFAGEVTGTFSYPVLDGWVGEGGSFAWWLEADLAAGSERLQLDGALGAGIGTGLHFDNITFGGSCGDDPTGAIQLRDEGGRWSRLQLGEECGGCGELTYADQVDMGTACVDFGSFFEDTLQQLRAEPVVSVY